MLEVFGGAKQRGVIVAISACHSGGPRFNLLLGPYDLKATSHQFQAGSYRFQEMEEMESREEMESKRLMEGGI